MTYNTEFNIFSLILEGFCENGHYQEEWLSEIENPCHHGIYCNTCNTRINFVNAIIPDKYGIKNGRIDTSKFLFLVSESGPIYTVPTIQEVIRNRVYFIAGKSKSRWVSLSEYESEKTDYDEYITDERYSEVKISPEEYFCLGCDFNLCGNCPYKKEI